MKVIKKNGKVESFSKNKLKVSLENSAKDINIFLTESDLNLILKDIIKIIKSINKDDLTSTYEVTGIVIQVLKDEGFEKIIESYIN